LVLTKYSADEMICEDRPVQPLTVKFINYDQNLLAKGEDFWWKSKHQGMTNFWS